MDAAEEARRRGDFETERAHFAEAQELAKSDQDRSEARYRAAESHVREGDLERGADALEDFARRSRDDPRSARAWLDAARAWEKAGRKSRALDAYRIVFERYPDSGGALSAAKRYVDLSASSEEEIVSIWKRLLTTNDSTDLDEGLRYNYARALERTSPRDAILAYEDVVRVHPLPGGRYADEALLRAALLRRRLGDPDGALTTLELLGQHGGKAAFVGSYTRPSYAEAQMLKGMILRDDKGALSDARRAFTLLVERYPQSRLVDDALFEHLLTVKMQGGDTCKAFRNLERVSPSSKYTRCERLICGTGPNPEPRNVRRCEEWLASAGTSSPQTGD